MGKRAREEGVAESSLNKSRCLTYIQQLWEQDELRMFCHPVSETELPDYRKVISNPIDLSTIRANIESDKYKNELEIQSDVARMIANAIEYNSPGTPWQQQALTFRRKYRELAIKCGLQVEEDAEYIPAKNCTDDEKTLRKAELAGVEDVNNVLKELEAEREVSLEELLAKYKRDGNNNNNSENGNISESDDEEEEDEEEDSDDEEEEEDEDEDEEEDEEEEDDDDDI